jgi:hypothetical protein
VKTAKTLDFVNNSGVLLITTALKPFIYRLFRGFLISGSKNPGGIEGKSP